MHLIGYLAVGTALAADVLANHVLHEKRAVAPPQWKKRDTVDLDAVIPLRIALQHQNMHLAEKFLYEVSHPSSEKYGQHWTTKQVAETFAPSKEAMRTVNMWLVDSGIHKTRIKQSAGLNWIEVNTTILEAEKLLKTEYHIYDHMISGQPQVACHEYHVPEHVTKHIDFITPTVHFDTPLNLKHRRSLPASEALPQKKHKREIRGRNVRTLGEAQAQAESDGPIPVNRVVSSGSGPFFQSYDFSRTNGMSNSEAMHSSRLPETHD